MKLYFLFLVLAFPLFSSAQRQVRFSKTDVLVIGGGAGGTAAAIQSARSGAKTILIEHTTMLGGMLTAAGVSCTDGNDQLPSGIWEEFRQALYKHYGRNRLNSGWVSNTNFEPHVGDSILKSMAKKEKNLVVHFGFQFESIKKEGNKVTGATFSNVDNSNVMKVEAKVVIDATELGDVMQAVAVGYDVGMDDPAVSGEKEARQKNNIIQDITWAAILKDFGSSADKTIERPANYNPANYYCCNKDAPCNEMLWDGDKVKMLNYGKLPRSQGITFDKYMLNWPAHGNDFYLNVIDSNYEARIRNYDLAKQYTLGFIYFMQTELGMKNIGLAEEELDRGLAWIPYNREGRRLKGVVRMNINHIKNPYDYKLYRTGIAVGDYPVDHHHAQYPGKVPEIEFPPIPSYNIPLGTLIPESVDGLIVCEKGISVTNIVNGTTRLQPVVLLTGQAAGVLASKSILEKKQPREINVRAVQEELLNAKCYLMPFSDIKPDDPHWEAIQKVGVTGILKGVGKAEGWSNKMFFYPDSLVDGTELFIGLRKLGNFSRSNHRLYRGAKPMTLRNCFSLIYRLRPFMKKKDFSNLKKVEELESFWKSWGLYEFNVDKLITRKELSIILDNCIYLLGTKNLPMDLNGEINFKYSQF